MDLPTTDSLLGAPPSPQGISPSNVPAVNNLLDAPQQSNIESETGKVFQSAVRTAMGPHAIAHAFWGNMSEGFQDPYMGMTPETVEETKQKGIFNKEDEHNTFKSIGRAFIEPAATALDTITRAPLAAMSAIPSTLQDVGTILGLPGAGKEAAFATTAGAEQFPMGVKSGLGIPHLPDLPVTLNRGTANFAIGVTEDKFLDPKLATPEESANATHAAAAVPGAKEPIAAPIIHDVVRQKQPALFNEWDALQTQRDTLGRWNRELAAKHQQDAIASAPHNQEIADLQAKIEEANPRKAKIYQEQINDLKAKNDAYVESRGISPDMKNVQDKYNEIDSRMREMAPQVSQLYRDTAKEMPPETVKPVDTGEDHTVIKPEEHGVPQRGPWDFEKQITEQQKYDAIVNDISNKAAAAGYGAEEAKASAQILARQYRYLADVYGQDISELYKKESADITNLTSKQQELRSKLGSYAAASDETKGIIRLFKSADASTLVHEGAHHFMNMLKRYEAQDGAPQKLKDDMKTIKDWLKVKEDGIFTTRMEEKFARGWEKYLMEGHAPSKELAGVFQKFEKWLKDIYGAIKNIPYGNISPEIKNFFDRVLTTGEETRDTITAPDNDVIQSDIPTGTGTGEGAPTKLPTKQETKGSGKVTSELVDKAGNIRVENLTSDEDIWDAMRQVAAKNNDFWEARNGVIPDQMVSDLADAMGIPAREINIKKLRQMSVDDGIPLAVRIRAGRQMLLDSTAKVIELSEKAATGDDAATLELEKSIARQLMIQETISGITAEIGRGLRAFQDLNKEKMGEAEQVNELLQRVTGRTPNEIRELAQQIKGIRDPEKAAKFLNDSRKVTKLDQLFLYRNRCLLSGPVTHTMVMFGHMNNALFRPLVGIPTAAALGRIAELLTGKDLPERVYLGEAKAQIWAMTKGSELGWQAMKDSWNTRLPLKLPGQPVPKWFANIGEKLPTTKFGTVMESTTRGITAMHSFFEALRFEQEYQGQIYRQAMSEGLEGQDFINRLTQLHQESPEDMMNAAAKETLHELYMDPLKKDDPLKGLMNFANSSVIGKALFPMIKIEYLIKRMVFGEYTPLGLFSRETRANLMGENGEAVRFMTMAKMSAGTAFMGMGYGLAAEGITTGSGPADPDMNKVWRLTHCPNSLQIGDVCIPLRSLGNTGQLLELGATIHEAVHNDKLKPDDEAFVKHTADIIEHVAKYAGDGTFVQTTQDILDAVRHHSEFGGQFLRNYATSYLPFSVGMHQMAQVFDRDKREVRSEGLDNAYGFFDAVKATIPGATYSLPYKFDIFGNPLKVGSSYDKYKDDPVVQKLDQLQLGVKYAKPEVLGIRLNNQQANELYQLSGQLVKESLDNLVGNGRLDSLSKVAQIELVHSTISKARESAKAVIKMEYPELVERALQNKQDLLYGQ